MENLSTLFHTYTQLHGTLSRNFKSSIFYGHGKTTVLRNVFSMRAIKCGRDEVYLLFTTVLDLELNLTMTQYCVTAGICHSFPAGGCKFDTIDVGIKMN